MVIRGRIRGNGKQLAAYLLSQAENEHIEILDVDGKEGANDNDLHRILATMSLTSELTKSDKGLYHVQINPAYGEDAAMTKESWLQCAQLLEQETGFNGQRRVIVLHTKKGRTHAHLVYERYDHDKGIMKSDSFSRLAQDRARQAMEIALNHQRTPERNKNWPDMKKCLIDLWNGTTTGKEFIQQAGMQGYTIAAGLQRRPFMIVDKEGRSFDLVRQLEKVRTREVRGRLKGEKLIGEKQAIEKIRQQQKQKEKHVSNDNSTKDITAFMFALGRSDIIKDGSDRQERERQRMKFGLMAQTANDIAKHHADGKTILAEAFAENKQSQLSMKDTETNASTEKRRKEILERLRQNRKKDKGFGYEF